jgi:hypothetical protein
MHAIVMLSLLFVCEELSLLFVCEERRAVKMQTSPPSFLCVCAEMWRGQLAWQFQRLLFCPIDPVCVCVPVCA